MGEVPSTGRDGAYASRWLIARPGLHAAYKTSFSSGRRGVTTLFLLAAFPHRSSTDDAIGPPASNGVDLGDARPNASNFPPAVRGVTRPPTGATLELVIPLHPCHGGIRGPIGNTSVLYEFYGAIRGGTGRSDAVNVRIWAQALSALSAMSSRYSRIWSVIGDHLRSQGHGRGLLGSSGKATGFSGPREIMCDKGRLSGQERAARKRGLPISHPPHRVVEATLESGDPAERRRSPIPSFPWNCH